MNTSETINELATAFAAAQADMPNATMNKTNPAFKAGGKPSLYADLGAVRAATLPALNKHGLSLLQTTALTDAGVVLVTRLIHKSGQWIEGEYPLQMAGTAQAQGSNITYARRYGWVSICGVYSEADPDDDGSAASAKPNGSGHAMEPTGPISAEQLTTLRNAVNEVEADEAAFAKYLKVPDLARLPASQYQRALTALDAKRARA